MESRQIAPQARLWAGRALALLLRLSILAATFRHALGSSIPWPASRPLRIFDSSAAPGSPSTWARARLVGGERSWGETFFALPVVLGEWSNLLAPRDLGLRAAARGAAIGVGAAWILVLLWWLAAAGARWHRPSLGLAMLILAQGFCVALWLGSIRAPVRGVRPASTCRAFDCGARTIGSGGLLAPQASIDWHRARGFSGLSFVGANLWPGQMQRLRRLNPDMILLDGSELSIQRLGQAPISTRPDAIEAWSGIVGDDALAARARASGVAAVGSTGSGAQCLVWSLLPSDVRTPADVVAAVKGRRVAVAHALLADETPANLQARRLEAGSLGALGKSWRQAMSRMSRAQSLNVFAQVLALLLCAICWGARSAEVTEAPSGPRTVMNFVRRKRLLRRLLGLALMLAALAGSACIGLVLLGVRPMPLAGLPAHWIVPLAVVLWIALDAVYLGARGQWKRAH